jgi:metal-dependent amidase/aminoacylase/carboxypeptidase family protein
MAENQTESSPLENEELPIPQFSEKGDSSTSSGADEIVSKLLPQLEQIIERKVQSQKDKRISEIEKVLGGRDKILAELESEGVNIPKDVRTQMQIRELTERLTQQSTQPAQQVVDGSTTQKAAVTDAIAELKKYDLSSNDADFLALLRGKYTNRAEFDLAVSRHVVGKLAPQKPANPADVVQSPARATVTTNTGDTASKIARLTELQKQPTKNRAEIAQLAAELDKAGWQ